MITKERLLKTIEGMPEQINVDDLLDRVLLIQKIEQGINQSEQGQVTSHETVKTEMEQWFMEHGY